MQTILGPLLQGEIEGERAKDILQKCVHCGFCSATCPTYQITGDELESPRGRIYLIKQIAEGQQPTRKTQQHLDHCLTCRNCETTCPSGVDYTALLDIGRKWTEQRVSHRPFSEYIIRKGLSFGLTHPLILRGALRLVRPLRWMFPERFQRYMNQPQLEDAVLASPFCHTRKVLLLEGCVQPELSPGINDSAVRILDRLAVTVLTAPGSGCCGALKFHLNEQSSAIDDMRRNIDAFWPYVTGDALECSGVPIEAILVTSSGCGVSLKHYVDYLKDDDTYHEKAHKISQLALDPIEWLERELTTLQSLMAGSGAKQVFFHSPCTLQHGMKLHGRVERLLEGLGIQVDVGCNRHLCCGSAGAYSWLYTDTAERLRQEKHGDLLSGKTLSPKDIMLSANVGCMLHLSDSQHSFRHWLEFLDEVLIRRSGT